MFRLGALCGGWLFLCACVTTPRVGVDAGSLSSDGGALSGGDGGTLLGEDGGPLDRGDAGTTLPEPDDGGTLPAARVPFAKLPAHNGTVVNPWSNGEPRIVKDRTPGKAGELLGFGWSDRLYLFASADHGDSWRFVDPTGNETIGTRDVLCAAQDSRGKIHLLFKNGPGGRVDYARVALSHTAGRVSGFASEVKGVSLPGGYNTNVDIRGTLQIIRDQSGAEVLAYEVNDNTTPLHFRVQMGVATSLDPAVSSDFVKLDGTAGATLVFGDANFNNHDHAASFAQLGASKDLWVFFGPVDAEYGSTDATFTTRIRLSPSGPKTWSVGTPIPMVGSDAISSPEALCVYGTQNYVWFLYFDPADGLSIDRVDAQGKYQHSAVPSPDPGKNRNGWGVFSVAADETRIWAIWNSMARQGPGVSDRTRQAFWNGATWTTYTDPMGGDSWGMGGSLGWGEGVVATRLGEPASDIALSTIRGGARAP